MKTYYRVGQIAQTRAELDLTENVSSNEARHHDRTVCTHPPLISQPPRLSQHAWTDVADHDSPTRLRNTYLPQSIKHHLRNALAFY